MKKVNVNNEYEKKEKKVYNYEFCVTFGKNDRKWISDNNINVSDYIVNSMKLFGNRVNKLTKIDNNVFMVETSGKFVNYVYLNKNVKGGWEHMNKVIKNDSIENIADKSVINENSDTDIDNLPF